MGLSPPRATGRVVLGGREVSALAPHARSKAGLGYVPQGRRVFASVTVAEHLKVVAGKGERTWSEERIYDLFPTLADRKDTVAGNLSGGQKSMLAFARALMTDPTCLVLDEPTEGLAPSIVEELCRVIRDMGRAGTPVLLVEQNIHAAEIAADRVVFLSAGRVARTCSSEEFQKDHALRDQFLGLTAIDA
jgi:branched-chain amino acid transport system ATP-binding protein